MKKSGSRPTNYCAKQRLLADRDYPVTMSSYWAQFYCLFPQIRMKINIFFVEFLYAGDKVHDGVFYSETL